MNKHREKLADFVWAELWLTCLTTAIRVYRVSKAWTEGAEVTTT